MFFIAQSRCPYEWSKARVDFRRGIEFKVKPILSELRNVSTLSIPVGLMHSFYA
jgi:hypothetical protein